MRHKLNTQHLKISLLFIFFLFSASCTIEIPQQKLLNIPYFSQGSLPWCGPACVKMWAEYQGLHPDIEDIANAICGPQGTTMYLISEAVTWFTRSTGVYIERGNSETEQDHCIATCFASLLKNRPAVIHINRDGVSDHHAIILCGAKYHYQLWPLETDPVIDAVRFHDPAIPNGGRPIRLPINFFKQYFYKPYQNRYMAVVGYPKAWYDGTQGYQEFLRRGGTYYGGPDPGMYQPVN